jgi:predicted transcriptional regulator
VAAVEEEAVAAVEEEAAVAGKIPGLILCLVGLAVAGFLVAGLLEGKLQVSGFMLGTILFVLPLLAGGVYVMIRSFQEADDLRKVKREKEILTMIEAQGRVKIPEICLNLHLDRSAVEALIRDLVGKGLFTGSINWQEGLLVSVEAKSMAQGKCPHCGGELQIAGKGFVRCPFCGSEVYH